MSGFSLYLLATVLLMLGTVKLRDSHEGAFYFPWSMLCFLALFLAYMAGLTAP